VANIGTWSFLQGTPAETFNKQDWSIFETSIADTLNNAQDSETKTWANPKTKMSGELQVLRTVKTAAQDCRLLKITNHAKDNTNEMELIFCKQPDGKWKIASPKVNK
jgi:surface antigen